MKKEKRNAFQKCMDFVDKIVQVICVVLMFAMLACVVLQVISRYFLPFSLSWTEELARFIMLWLIFLGASHIAKASSYIKVDFLVKKLPAKVQFVCNVIVKVMILGTAAHYAWNCFSVFSTVMTQEVSPSMQIPMVIPRFSLVVGFVLIFLQALSAGGFVLLPSEEEEDMEI